jgi:hypothetical protein
MYDRALRGYAEAVGLDHTSTLDTVNNLGLLTRTKAGWSRRSRRTSEVCEDTRHSTVFKSSSTCQHSTP